VKKGYRKSEKFATLSPEQLEEVLAQSDTEHPVDLLARMGAQALLQAALEAEIEEALGRAFYGRRTDEQQGYRNGSRERTLTSGVGKLTLQVPRVADTQEPFHSKVLPAQARIVPKLTGLFPSLYIEGLSTRDFSRAMKGAFGDAGMSKSSISRANKVIHEEFEAWRKRSLADEDVVYLFLDGVYLQIRRNSSETEGVLVAHGIRADGSRVLLGVMLGYQESTSSWKDFLHNLTNRGLKAPPLVISDGNPGLLRAVGEVWPETAVQRCIAHRMRNILDKTPKAHREAVHRDLRTIFYAATETEARAMVTKFAAKWGGSLPTMTQCLLAAIDACLTFYRFPEIHWVRIRTSNVLERCFKEVKRRTRVIGRFPTDNEKPALALLWAVLCEQRSGWHGMQMQPDILLLIRQVLTTLPKSMLAMNNMIAGADVTIEIAA
jgi:transposase-like protein